MDEVDRFRECRERLERWGLRPTPACHYRRNPGSGEPVGLYLALEFREDVEDYLVKLPDHVETALPGHEVIGAPHLCVEASQLLGKQVVVLRTRDRRRAA